MRPPAPYHNLRSNAAERSPRHLAVLDCETEWRETNDGEMHTLRLWAARLTHRGHDHPRLKAGASAWGRTTDELIDTLDQWTRHAGSLWCYLHNANFDLAVTRLPMRLAERGWVLGDHGLTLAKPWFRMRLGNHCLTVLDSTSILPASLERIGVKMGVRKAPLPDNADSMRRWLNRCEQDVIILTMALQQIMDWWDENRLGCWSLTGAGTGWNAYRHRRSRVTVAIDPSPEARALERRAISGGRRDVWRVGHLPRATYWMLDFEQAHLTVCRHFPLPRRRGFRFAGTWKDRDWQDPDRFGAVADCTVRTETARYPVRIDGRWWHPTGQMRTVLAWPELYDAHQRGDLVEIHGGYTQWLAPHMADWAEWVAGLLADDTRQTPPMAQLAAKGWSRSVPGKWATRTSREIDERPSTVQGWAIERGMLHPDEVPLTMLHMDGRQVWLAGDQEADDSFPAVLAYIQSHVRLRLNRMIDALPAESLVACNTDGVLVRMQARPDVDALAAAAWPLLPRVKAVYHDVHVLGPNHLLLDGRSHLSGVPVTAKQVAPLVFKWNTWPGLRSQVNLAPEGGYLRPGRHVDLSAVPVPRWVVEDGHAVPPRAVTTVVGATELLPWPLTPSARLQQALRRPQHPVLERAMGRYGEGDAIALHLAASA